VTPALRRALGLSALLALGAAGHAQAAPTLVMQPMPDAVRTVAFGWSWQDADPQGPDEAPFSAGSARQGYDVVTSTGVVLASAEGPGRRFAQPAAPPADGLYSLRVRARECFGSPAACAGPAYTPYVLAVSAPRTVRVDRTPPTATMAIAGGAPYTTSRSVLLSLGAADPGGSGVGSVQVSHDGTFGCGTDDTGEQLCPQPFTASLPATLPEGPDGPRSVAVVVFDRAEDPEGAAGGYVDPGNASTPVTDGIFLDRVAPTAVPAGPSAAGAGQTAAFSAAGSRDDTDGADDSGVDPAGTTWDWGDGTTSAGAAATHAWSGPGTYAVTLRVRDRAGNTGTATRTVAVTGAGAPAAAGGGGAPVVTTPPPGPSAPAAAQGPARLTGLRTLGTARARGTVRVQLRLSARGRVTLRLHRVGRGGRLGAVVARVGRSAGPGVTRLGLRLPAAGSYRLVALVDGRRRAQRGLRVLPVRRAR